MNTPHPRLGKTYPHLFHCPLCGHGPYTAPGLRIHRCPMLPVMTLRSASGRSARYHARLDDAHIERAIADQRGERKS